MVDILLSAAFLTVSKSPLPSNGKLKGHARLSDFCALRSDAARIELSAVCCGLYGALRLGPARVVRASGQYGAAAEAWGVHRPLLPGGR